MKPLQSAPKAAWLSALLLLLVSLQVASAFYDPGLQRWLNRDPFDDDGFQTVRNYNGNRGPIRNNKNGFLFVINNPPNQIDPLGLVEFDGSCSEKQQNMINASMDRGCQKAKQNGCFSKCGSKANEDALNKWCGNGAKGEKFSCPPASDTGHCGQGQFGTNCGKTDRDTGTIYMCPDAFKGSCGDVACTVIHELVHATSPDYDHKPGNPGAGTADDIEKCLGLGCPGRGAVPK